MVVGIVLIALGLPLTVVGVRQATERPRPQSLLGMLLAPTGLLLALAGVARIVNPHFFGG